LWSVGTYFQRVVGSEPNAWAWSRANHHYQEVDSALTRLGAQDDQRVLVNDPPGYYLASGREAIVIPYGDEDMLLSAARQFQVDYLVLELNNPWMLEALYLRQSSRREIVFLEAVGTTHLYQINRGGAGVP
jgi:hypothetical protein